MVQSFCSFVYLYVVASFFLMQFGIRQAGASRIVSDTLVTRRLTLSVDTEREIVP